MTDPEITARIAKSLGIEGYAFGGAGGLAQIAACSWKFVPAEQPAIEQWLCSQAEALDTAPLQYFDPLGYAIIDTAMLDKEINLTLLKTSSSAQAVRKILEGARWNPVCCDTLLETLGILFDTAGLNKPATGERFRSSVLARLRAQYRHLWATGYLELGAEDFLVSENVPAKETGAATATRKSCLRVGEEVPARGTFGWFRARALKHLQKTDPDVLEKIPPNWASSTVTSHRGTKMTVGAEFLNLARVRPYILTNTLLAAAVRCESEDAPVSQPELPPAAEADDKSASRKKTWAPTALSTLAPPRSPGRAAFSLIVKQAVLALSDPGAATVAFTAACGIAARNVSPSHIEPYSNGCLVTIPVANPARGADTNLDLNEASGSTLCVVVPLEVGVAMKRHLEKFSAKNLEAKADNFLQFFRFYPSTYATLRVSIRQCVPVWHQVPAIQFRIAGDPQATTVQPWQHYVNWNLAHFSTAIRAYLRKFFDPGFDLPELDSLPSCGSPFTPRLHVVRELFSEFLAIIGHQGHGGSLEEQISRFNLVGACSRYAESLLTFSRGQNDFPPLGVRGNGRTSAITAIASPRIIIEKGFKRIIHFAPLLVSIMERVAVWQRLAFVEINRSGGNAKNTQALNRAYGILTPIHSSTGEIEALHLKDPSRQNLVIALSSPQNRRFLTLDPKWARHFSNLHLRTGGFRELDVLAAMDHFVDRRMGPLAFDSVHLGLSSATIFLMADHVANVAGLS